MANTFQLRTGVFVVGMAASIAASVALTPKPMHTAGAAPPMSLSQVVPKAFGNWVIDESAPPQIVNPTLQATLDEHYSDTLTRNYIDPQGNRIMLSVAYGADQSRALQVHKPEHCYDAFGYKLTGIYKDALPTSSVGSIPVMRLVATKDARIEPITYWIKSGDYLIRGWVEQNVARVKSGLKGHLPDGLLVRVSTIEADPKHAYSVQTRFVNDMIGAIKPQGQQFLLGTNFMAKQPPTP
jgi:EpsI family protein